MWNLAPSSMVVMTSTPNSNAKHSQVHKFDGLCWGDVSLDSLDVLSSL